MQTGANVGTCDASGGPRIASKSSNMFRFNMTTLTRDDLDKAPPPFIKDEEVESAALEELATTEPAPPLPIPMLDFTPLLPLL